MRPPSFPFYVNNWLASRRVSAMTPAQEGAFIRLLAHSWGEDDCGLPDDDEELAILSRLGADWHKAKVKILKCFVKKGGRLYNERLLACFKQAMEYSELQSAKGRRSGEVRRNRGSTTAEPVLNSESESESEIEIDGVRTTPPAPDEDKKRLYATMGNDKVKHAGPYVAFVDEFASRVHVAYADFMLTFHTYGASDGLFDEVFPAVMTDLRLRPDHEWERYGARLLGFAVEKAAKRIGRAPKSIDKAESLTERCPSCLSPRNGRETCTNWAPCDREIKRIGWVTA